MKSLQDQTVIPSFPLSLPVHRECYSCPSNMNMKKKRGKEREREREREREIFSFTIVISKYL